MSDRIAACQERCPDGAGREIYERAEPVCGGFIGEVIFWMVVKSPKGEKAVVTIPARERTAGLSTTSVKVGEECGGSIRS
jgi:hypothetical protein